MRATEMGSRTSPGQGGKRRVSAFLVLGALAALVAGVSLGQSSCASTPDSIAVRTFDRPEQIAVACMKVLDDLGNAIPAEPVTEENCAPVPAGVEGRFLQFHLYALVTQTTRGEVGVVDLTAGFVVDEDRSTPGINFIPVGATPRDIAVASNGKLTFVTSAEPNKWAIYAIPNQQILGDSQGLPQDLQQQRPLLNLPALPACQLPQAPGAIAVVRRPERDVSAADPQYELVVVLVGNGGSVAPKVLTLDPQAFINGAGQNPGGTGPSFEPGALPPCTDAITAAVDISPAVPSQWSPGPPWNDGLVYVDGGVNAVAPFAEDADVFPLPTFEDARQDSDAAIPIDDHLLDGPRPTTVAFDTAGRILYIGDGARPIIHAIDLSVASSPRELPPLVATSTLNPARQVQIGPMAVSPTTSDFKRYLYAVDQEEGSIIVYDVSDPHSTTVPRVPLQRPHPEINPTQPPDRITFPTPVKSVAFVQHDWPLTHRGDPSVLENKLPAAITGVLCNPSPKIQANATGIFSSSDSSGDAGAAINGAYYRMGTGNQQVDLGPTRLRGVFGFAVLSSGLLEAIDVDDWDAPCRRPDPMTQPWQLSSLQVPQPDAVPGDFDPYHVPQAFVTGTSPVTDESFFPVSMPHRARSDFLLRRDPTSGTHIPNLRAAPELRLDDATKSTTGPDGFNFPIMMPTLMPGGVTVLSDPTYVSNPTEPNPSARTLGAGFIDSISDTKNGKIDLSFPTPNNRVGAGVRLAWEDPTVHLAQDWTVTYEGALPDFDGVVGTLQTDNDEALTLRNDAALFCRRGVEDWAFGQQRVDQQAPEYPRLNIAAPPSPKEWTGDYIQVTDDVLLVDDAYWQDNSNLACWTYGDQTLSDATSRHDFCAGAFGDQDDLDTRLSRDFPILEAYEDHLVLGRFGQPAGATSLTGLNRTIVSKDPSNQPFLKQLRCCFHNQVHFRVRTGGEWVAVGTLSGYFHHVTSDAGGRCVQSTIPREQLLNARVPDLTRFAFDPTNPQITPPTRYSPLAMRNPIFSFVMWRAGSPLGPFDHTATQRDLVFKFTTQGEFIPLTVNLSPTSTVINPVAVQFIASLGQLAVIDGAQQGSGLILVDLSTLAFSHDPYF